VNWTYASIMAVAIGTGLLLFLRRREPLGLSGWESFGIALGGFCGSMIGAKLPFVLADWQGLLRGTAWFDDGKTIMAGLVGGYLGAVVAEWALDVRVHLGDSLAVPVAAAVGVGRLACFSAGCCYGTVTSLPWGVDFGDGLARHPTQLYESAFHLLAAVVLYQFQRRQMFRGRLIQAYFVAYFVYRFASELIRPEPALWLGLTGYQWAALVLAPFFAVWSCPSCRPQRAHRRRTAPRNALPGRPGCYALKATETLCPDCLRPVPGMVYEQEGKVFLERDCPEHGRTPALVSSDRRYYWLRDEVPHGPPAGERCCCGAPGHKTCVALLEVTEACNLRCPVCYAQSPSGTGRRFEDLCADLEDFLAVRGPLDVLQLSGGEPLVHPDLLRLIDRCKQLPIDHVMINTNGLELLNRATLAAELARRRPRLELWLQFDGLDAGSHLALRGADLLEQKRAVIEKIVQFDLPTTLVCTLVKGVNEQQVGPLFRLGLQTRQLRGITFQPATFCGRFRREANRLDRITAADVVNLLVDQSGGLFAEEDFKPLPCANPNCCQFTFAVRPRNRPVLPLTRVIKYERHLQRLADRVSFNLDDAQEVCGGGWKADDFFRIVIKPFMDAYTYDRERIEECCVHVIRPGGRAVSFCQFNVLERGQRTSKPACAAEYADGVERAWA